MNYLSVFFVLKITVVRGNLMLQRNFNCIIRVKFFTLIVSFRTIGVSFIGQS